MTTSIGSQDAHRLAYMLWHGDIPDKKVIRHTCGNRNCVKHLIIGSQKQNIHDAMAAGDHICVKGRCGEPAISPKDLPKVKELILQQKMSQREIGEIFGVEYYVIGRIKRKMQHEIDAYNRHRDLIKLRTDLLNAGFEVPELKEPSVADQYPNLFAPV